MRRALGTAAVLAITGTGWLGMAPAAAQDTLPQGWERSSAVVEGTRLVGAMERSPSPILGREYVVTVGIVIARPAGLPAACTVPTVAPPPAAQRRVPFDVSPGFECNGAYPVAINARADQDGGAATLQRTLVAAMPAPAVTGVAVAMDGDAVDIAWDDMTAQAKDLTGYQVHRQVGTATPTVVAEVSPNPEGSIPTTARDEDLPDTDEVLTYRVVAVRNGTGPGPAGESSDASITRQGEVVDTPPGAGGDADGSATGDGGAQEPDSGGPDGGARPSRFAPPRVGISGTFGSPRLTPGPSAAASSTTADSGFDEELPYDPVDGPADAEPPDDELAAFFTEEAAGRGMAIPVATALVLAVWAFHLRVLARAAKPPA